jgi:hypothetical protein
MKTILFTICMSLGLTLSAQTNFAWDEIIELDGQSKDQIYSKTKLYVADTWKSANDVIQNDDKEAGLILLKGSTMQNLVYQTLDHKYYFSYTIKLYQKDDKARMTIDNVNCTNVIVTGNYDWAKPPVADAYPEDKGMKLTSMTEKNYLKLMEMLKSDIQLIADKFKSDMVKPLATENDNW